MTTKREKIEQAITDFVKGGDNSDTLLLDRVLHKDFRVASNAFMGTQGVTIIDKQKYLANIEAGIFGGLPRKMNIESIDDNDTIAMVKLRIESAENHFISYNSFVLDVDNEWKLIHNLAVVAPKNR
ncbi:MAG: nuclear transport factor 2 family protein [Bacteroidota bacterium]